LMEASFLRSESKFDKARMGSTGGRMES